MPRPVCTVCTHKRVGEIDTQLAEGVSALSIARRTKLSQSALLRHKKRHLPGAIVEVVQERADSALSRLELLLPRLERLLDLAERGGRSRDALAAIRELRLCFELAARITGEIRDTPTVQVNLLTSPDWLMLRAGILDALSGYPEARFAMLQRLELMDGATRD